MRISFDLDDTLICPQENVPAEPNPVPLLLRLWWHEPLRLGTCDLIKALEQRGFEVCIYTTSYRSPCYIRLWLYFYGIRVSKIINQTIHNACLNRASNGFLPSKNPAAFGIPIHVDDSAGVKLEGDRYGFEVIVVSPQDRNWTEKILQQVPHLA